MAKQEQVKQESESGFYIYQDGYAYWGIGLNREGEIPLKTTAEVEKSTLEDKVKWYNAEAERIAKINAEAKAKEDEGKESRKKSK